MRSYVRRAALLGGILSMSLGVVGCWKGGEVEETAKEALGGKGTGTERTVESQQHVIVQDTKKVIDSDTGQVLKTEETKTPVTITEQRTTERNVEVKSGETKKTIK
jgi:hypothetical protein